MKKLGIVAGIGAALFATAASAADLGYKKQAPVSYTRAPAFTWTGFYAGGNLGYGFGSVHGRSGGAFKDPSGVIGGGQIGYNYQMGQTVLGVETDLQATGIRASNTAAGVAGAKVSQPYLGTVRVRAGYAVDRFLPYLTAGFAYGGMHYKVPGVGASTTTNYGWTAGGGVEYAFTNNITAKVEGLYVDLASKSALNNAVKGGAREGIVRTGLNYKF
ncbi:MAG: porin family protein [Proteobacteria bacterium]|nr:porin family protein [Pseudomonadota bacterium]